MKLFRLYFRSRIKGIVVFLLFSGLFALSFLLYHLPVGAVLYPVLLCAFLGSIFIGIDFGRVRKKHLRLLKMKGLTAAMMSSFPDVEGVEDYDYQEIIKSLCKEEAASRLASSCEYRNMVDYYTVWVHQIKTPIASMRLNLQNEDSPLARALLSDLRRIEQYVEMVLAYLRLDSVSSDYVFREHCVDTMIRQSIKKFASEFITRKIRLEYQPVTETIVTDDKWFSFVLEQVLSNALKYTRQGGKVRIYLTEQKTLCVEDTGIGIAPGDLPRIFDRGYTGYNGRRDKQASGIGLYLCRRICKNLGLSISAASEPDKGTVISIDLEQKQLRVE